MSRYGFALLAVTAFVSLLMIAPNMASGQEYTPNVTLVGSSTMLSVQDANRSEVNYSAYDYLYGTSVHVSVITAQLFLNEKPYSMSGIPITFSSDNDSIAVLEPLNRTRPSDEHGQAKILLISNNTVGYVHITARANPPPYWEISDTCTVHVVGWGTVSGFVTDKNQNGVPYAKMTLWQWKWEGQPNEVMLRSPDNPQWTNDGRTATIGTYTFTYVPAGLYNLTAEKDGHEYFAMVNVTAGTYTANVVLPDYVYIVPVTPTPTPGPAATSSNPSASPSATPAPGFESIVSLSAIGLGLLLVTVRRGRK
ncbi:MAG: carboxypeptidase-like regulatory domain-containing protein [Methanocella sp.]